MAATVEIAPDKVAGAKEALSRLEEGTMPPKERIEDLRICLDTVAVNTTDVDDGIPAQDLDSDIRESFVQLVRHEPVTYPKFKLPSDNKRRPSTDISQKLKEQLKQAERDFAWDPRSFGEDKNRVLSVLAMHLFEVTGLIQDFSLDVRKLDRFLQTIERGYNSRLPYHNALHAAAVLQKIHIILVEGKALEKIALTEEERAVIQFAMYFAAIVHDHRHGGVTNSYLTTTGDPLAIRYNDHSPLENHHLASAFDILNQPDKNFMLRLDDTVRRTIRMHVIDAVKATDMHYHFTTMDHFSKILFKKNLSNDGVWFQSHAERTVALQLCLKCADLAHMTCETSDHETWVNQLQEEFFLQGDRERRCGMSVSPLMDRRKRGLTASQKKFLEIFVLPMYNQLAEAFNETQPLYQQVALNYRYWCNNS